MVHTATTLAAAALAAVAAATAAAEPANGRQVDAQHTVITSAPPKRGCTDSIVTLAHNEGATNRHSLIIWQALCAQTAATITNVFNNYHQQKWREQRSSSSSSGGEEKPTPNWPPLREWRVVRWPARLMKKRQLQAAGCCDGNSLSGESDILCVWYY